MTSIRNIKFIIAAAFAVISSIASAQKYPDGIIDKTVAVVGNEMITISDLEEEVQMMQAYGKIPIGRGHTSNNLHLLL